MNQLKEWREKNNITQAEAADILGYKSYVSISLIETGKQPIPKQLSMLLTLMEKVK